MRIQVRLSGAMRASRGFEAHHWLPYVSALVRLLPAQSFALTSTLLLVTRWGKCCSSCRAKGSSTLALPAEV